MADAVWHSRVSYFYCTMSVWVTGQGSNYHNLHWQCYLHHKRISVGAYGSWRFSINGQVFTCGSPAIRLNGEGDAYISSGDVTIYHTDGINVGFDFWGNPRKWYNI